MVDRNEQSLTDQDSWVGNAILTLKGPTVQTGNNSIQGTFSVEPVTPVTSVTRKYYGCKGASISRYLQPCTSKLWLKIALTAMAVHSLLRTLDICALRPRARSFHT